MSGTSGATRRGLDSPRAIVTHAFSLFWYYYFFSPPA